MAEIKEQLLTLFAKVWVWLLLIVAGLIGQLSMNILQGRKMSALQYAACFGVGMFIGIVAACLCVYKDWTKAGIVIVPIATSMSEKIMMALFSIDYKEIKQILVELLTRRKSS